MMHALPVSAFPIAPLFGLLMTAGKENVVSLSLAYSTKLGMWVSPACWFQRETLGGMEQITL
jgi:hypothetical protein